MENIWASLEEACSHGVKVSGWTTQTGLLFKKFGKPKVLTRIVRFKHNLIILVIYQTSVFALNDYFAFSILVTK